ncbi:MAG: HD-GYP domain-containing protein [Desulfonatronovibrionaceae bacterium]
MTRFRKKTQNEQPGSAENKKNYFPISPLILQTDTASDFRVFLYNNEQYVLYTRERERFTQELKKKLYESGTKHVYVPIEQKEEYDRYVDENFGAILNDSSIPIEERSKIFLNHSNSLVQEIFNNRLPSGVTKGYLGKVKKIVQETLDFLSHRDSISNIGKLISHDYKTYSHSVHVFTYTMALMHNHDYSQKEKIDVGIGALLHDLGKQNIPNRILNKPGRLDAEEWILVKRHPVYGIGQCSNLPLSHLTFKSILFHHERFDGSGYPTGIEGRNIPLPVRYLTCCDVYDAITSERPYAPAETTFNALKIMRNNMQDAFDMDAFKELVTLLSNTRIA